MRCPASPRSPSSSRRQYSARVGWLWTAARRSVSWSAPPSPARANASCSASKPAAESAAAAASSKPRILSRPPCYEDVEYCIQTQQWELLKRNADQNKIYYAFAARILEGYETVGDELLERLWGFPLVPSAARPGTVRADRGGKEVPPGARALLRNNNFPYELAEEVTHHVLWSLDPMSPAQVRALLEGELRGRRWVFYENPPAKKTVPTIWHVQVFSAAL
eukprot:tig00000478_g1255.t1